MDRCIRYLGCWLWDIYHIMCLFSNSTDPRGWKKNGFYSGFDLLYSHSTFKIPIISPFSESRHFRHIQHVRTPRNIEQGQKCRFFLTQYRPGFKFDLVPKSWNDLFDSHSTLNIAIISSFSENRHFTHIQHAIKPRNIEQGLKVSLFSYSIEPWV